MLHAFEFSYDGKWFQGTVIVVAYTEDAVREKLAGYPNLRLKKVYPLHPDLDAVVIHDDDGDY